MTDEQSQVEPDVELAALDAPVDLIPVDLPVDLIPVDLPVDLIPVECIPEPPASKRKARSHSSKPYHSTDTWSGTFVPNCVTRSDEFTTMSMPARLMIYAMLDQEFARGRANGRLEISERAIRDLSRATIYRARDELLERGFIVRTKAADHIGRPDSYALTFVAISPSIAAGLEVAPWTDTPPHSWRKTTPAPTKTAPADGFAARWSGPTPASTKKAAA